MSDKLFMSWVVLREGGQCVGRIIFSPKLKTESENTIKLKSKCATFFLTLDMWPVNGSSYSA